MSEIELIYKPFISESKSKVIAPAGHGKTHCIVESLNLSEDNQLILTHTNAGVASIKEKVGKVGVKTTFSVETICGFAQKYVEAFISKELIPEQDNSDYFPFVVNTAIELFNRKAIQKVIKANHSGLFVDEYQDCTKSQHELITVLSGFLPTHILGDPLQGIFDFNNEELVDFNADLDDYKFTAELKTPWRWENSNKGLGEDLQKMRNKLIETNQINISDYQSFEANYHAERELFDFRNDYGKKLWGIINREESLLIIHPISHNLNARTKLVKHFNNSFYLVEAMDAKDFYSLAKKVDDSSSANIYSIIHEISLILFSKTKTEIWLGTTRLKNKRDFEARITIEPLKETIANLENSFQLRMVAKALRLIKELPKNKCYRAELFYDLIKAIEQADINGKTVFESMKEIRDSKRHIGRKVSGKCIGTTLLTKGLEFDTVVILNAQRFDCPRNFYVALTRASRRLIIFSDRDEISFN